MKKEILVAFIAIGFIFAGAISASAGTISWTLIETVGMKLHFPGTDNLLGTSDDVLTAKCNYSNASACVVTGVPTQGTYSFAKLDFVQTSSCALGANQGQFCTQNSDCGGLVPVCVDCNTTAGGVAYTYFAKNPTGGSKGLGTMTESACDNGFDWTNISIGTSEVVGGSGGGCMTLTAGSGKTNSGCGVGALSTNMTLDLYTSTIANCGFKAGVMPGLVLAGAVIDAGAGASGSVCGYTVGQLGAIITAAGLGTGSYMSVLCGNGTLPTDLQSGCLPGADWRTVMLSKTSANVPSSCGEACSSGCMAGTAEGVE
jgi:hypothetical protein